MTRVCYCADDYGLSPAISSGIIDLIAQHRLHATSCMTQAEDWVQSARQLKPYLSTIDIGLHLNFTHLFYPATFAFSLRQLMQSAWLHTLDRTQVRESIIQQWQHFTDVLGKAPDFVDGHQHIHQFPVIREVLVEFLIEKKFTGWVRNLQHSLVAPHYRFKTQMLMLLGSKALHKLCSEAGIKQNQSFAGIYDFQHVNYAELNQTWLAQAQDGLLIMCHPAQVSNSNTDLIHAAREQEYQYFASENFLNDCNAHHITLGRIGEEQ